MTEILTESFCERCGTRYTFESAAPRKSRLGRVRTLSKGVRNFVLSDDSSFSEALAEARSEAELAATSHQLDAFHQTFNFCLTCRQYTCGDCWNVGEGRCLTCAPMPGQEEPVSPLALGALASEAPELALTGANGHDAEDLGVEAWPEMDLPAARLARVLDLAPEPEPEPLEAVETAAVDTGAEGAAEAWVAEVAGEPAGEEPETAPETMLIGVAPGQSLDDAIAEYEARIAAEEAAEAAMHAEEADALVLAEEVAAEPEPEPEPVPLVVEVAAEPVVTGPEAEPESAEPPVLAEPEAEPAVAAAPQPSAEPEPVAATPAPTDRIEQPTWPVAPPPAVRVPPPPAPGPTPSPWLTVAPDDTPAPQWPTNPPQWPGATSRQNAPASLAGRPLLPQADASALWAASNQEVLGAAPAPLPGSGSVAQAQPCVSCGLSLSANARFCRRCGTRQG